MRKIGIICGAVMIIMIAGCNNTEDTREPVKIEYSEEKGTVSGVADFSSETPNIVISDIVAYVGSDIDYSSGVKVTNADSFDDFQMWIDASKVDIYTEGTYEAVYRFVYDGETIEKTIKVTMIQDTREPSGDWQNNGTTSVSQNGNQNNNGSGNVNSSGSEQTTVSTSDAGGSSNTNAGGENSQNAGDGGNNGSSGSNGNAGGNGSSSGSNGNAGGNGSSSGGNGNTGGNGSSNNSGQTAANTENKETTRRQIITSSNTDKTKAYTLGYMDIELLSGSTVKIKCTSSKYIVSTRTDISNITKNGVNYKVYELIITYNTGAEQVLEAYEEKQ